AKVLEVKILPKNKALALVPEDQISLAIGRDGQNVRLAAKLTGWKIDVRSLEKVEEEIEEDKSSSRPSPPKGDSEKEEIIVEKEKPKKKAKTSKNKNQK
ncbi:transcription termination/antitermination protein NusA, partial [Candidatus Shapirobacteria bacterium CG10_big_fil_rev_8_21_14_0_10_38_14]